jgi:hypothetical protein
MSGRAGLSVKVARHFDENRISCLEACHVTSEHLKSAGFILAWTSLKSEACYYAFRGRWGVVRIATHSKGGRNPDMKNGPTVVSVTFPEANLRGFTREYVENHTANAIGLYLIRSQLTN